MNAFSSNMAQGITVCLLYFIKIKYVHSDSKTLNGEINQRSASYLLKLANRLYGEKTFNLLPVSISELSVISDGLKKFN